LVTVDLEAPPPSPDAYVDMGPVEPSHYQGLWELRRGLQLEQQDVEEEEEQQSFVMELVSIFNITICSDVTLMLLSWCPR
jgi:hypothetical protein